MNEKHPLKVRPATTEDLELVIALAARTRQRLALWAPIYFHPADQADDLHAAFLEFMLGSEDFTTKALTTEDSAVGFYVEHTQESQGHTWIDDLSVINETHWPSAVEAIMQAVTEPWVTCVPSKDTVRAAALHDRGLRTVSSYWARTTLGVSPAEPAAFDLTNFDAGNAATHTFGDQAFHPDLPGALVVGSSQGYAIGSPSATPPLYNPGGPTTVIDQVVGSDRAAIVQQALAASGERGDAQLVVVCSHHDRELQEIVDRAGFDRVVDLIGTR